MTDRTNGSGDDTHRLFLAVIVSAVFVSVVTGNMVNILLPAMKREFAASPAQIGWVVTAYSLVYAVGIPLYGKISDFFGARRIYTVGLSTFSLGCLIAATAPGFPLLIAGRLVQGAGGAAIAALGIVVVTKVMPEQRRGAALGLVASSAGLGSVVGPISGGAIGQLFGWRGLFVVPLVLMLALIPVARRVLPDDHGAGERRFDVIGGLFLGLAAGCLLLGITRGQAAGFGSASSWGSVVAAGPAAAAFGWRIVSTTHPFVPPDLLRNAAYLRVVATGFLTTFTYMSVLILAPLLLVDVNGLTTSEAGLVLTPGAVAVVVGARLSGRLSDRIGPRIPVTAGLITLALAIVYLSTVAAGGSSWLVTLGAILASAGASLVNTPLNNAAAKTLPRQHMGVGMGLHSGTAFLGGGAGVAVAGAILAARQDAATGALNPFYRLDAAAFSDAFLAIALVPLVALALARSLGAPTVTPATVEAPLAPRAAERLETQRT